MSDAGPKHFFAASTGGFYRDDFHPQRPADAVEISEGERDDLFAAQGAGAVIVAGGDGRPVAQARVPTRAEALAHLAARRWDVQRLITFAGHPAASDDVAATRLLTKIQTMEGNGAAETDLVVWKMADGDFVQLQLAQLRAMLAAGAAHVEACFVVEATVAAMVAAAATDADAWAIVQAAEFPGGVE